MLDQFFSMTAHWPLSEEARLLLSMMILSIAASIAVIIRNRKALSGSDYEEEEDALRLPSEIDSGLPEQNPLLTWLDMLSPHLNELRRRVTYSVIAIIVAGIATAIVAEDIMIVLAEPIGGLDNLIAIGVTENVSVFFRIMITFGIILASPYVIAQMWIFVAAGLFEKEKRQVYFLFPLATILFISGVAFTFFVMLPVTVPFLTEFIIPTKPTLDNYIDFVTNILLYIGLSFEIPMVLFILAKLGVVNSKMLLKNWRFAIIGIAIVAALVTPTPDPINMGLASAPLVILYILSIILTRFA